MDDSIKDLLHTENIDFLEGVNPVPPGTETFSNKGSESFLGGGNAVKVDKRTSILNPTVLESARRKDATDLGKVRTLLAQEADGVVLTSDKLGVIVNNEEPTHQKETGEKPKVVDGFLSKDLFPEPAKEKATQIEDLLKVKLDAISQQIDQDPKKLYALVVEKTIREVLVYDDEIGKHRLPSYAYDGVDGIRPWITAEMYVLVKDYAERIALQTNGDIQKIARNMIYSRSGEDVVDKVNTRLQEPHVLVHATSFGKDIVKSGHLQSRIKQEERTGKSNFATGTGNQLKREDQEMDQICFASDSLVRNYGGDHNSNGALILTFPESAFVTNPEMSMFIDDGLHLFQDGGFDIDLTDPNIDFQLVSTPDSYQSMMQGKKGGSGWGLGGKQAYQAVPPSLNETERSLVDEHYIKDENGNPILVDSTYRDWGMQADEARTYSDVMMQRVKNKFKESGAYPDVKGRKGFFVPTGNLGDGTLGEKNYTYKWQWTS